VRDLAVAAVAMRDLSAAPRNLFSPYV
jgi:hypothetical protein